MSRPDIAARIRSAGVVAIVRRSIQAEIEAIVHALVDSGVTCVEVALGRPDSLRAIGRLASTLPELCLGAGTALSADDVRRAHEAGAAFVLSPILQRVFVKAAHDRGMAAIPGAYSPTELWAAHRAGADLIKVFPARAVDRGYIKDVLAPLPDLKLMPVGGIEIEHVPGWLSSGAWAIGIGAPLIGPESAPIDLEGIKAAGRRLVRAVHEVRP